jgi:hypothetical protein
MFNRFDGLEEGGERMVRRVGVVPIRNWRRQGKRKAFHLYHTRMSGDNGDGDIVGCGGLWWGSTVYSQVATRAHRFKWIFFELHNK